MKILKHLYEQSNHQNIKSGDLFICELSGVIYENVQYPAIGIFKSENKAQFIKVIENKNIINLQREIGISIKKIDKACLIINTEKENGYIN